MTPCTQYTRHTQLVQLRRPKAKARSRLAIALLIVASTVLGTSCSRPSSPRSLPADTLTAWMHLVATRIKADKLNPAQASRIFAYIAIAQYEAMVPGVGDRRSLGGQLNGLASLPEARRDSSLDWPSAQAAAVERVGSRVFESSPASVAALTGFYDATLAARRAAGISAETEYRSLAFGRAVGVAIARWADADGFFQIHDLPYTRAKGPEHWVPTGGASDQIKPAEPHWGNMRPFALSTADTCQPGPPEPYAETGDSPLLAQAKAVYDTSDALTSDQRDIALAWADNPGQTPSPSGHWIELVGQIVGHRSLAEASESYALVAISMADAFIACWQAKYTYSLLRPETFIRRRIDPNWQPLLVTPQFPEYPSGHAVVSSAAATVLDALLSAPAFDDHTVEALGYRARHFKSFTEAAAEAAQSRLYAGIHYPMSATHGLEQGRCVGEQVLAHALTRSHALEPVKPAPKAVESASTSASIPGPVASQLSLSSEDSACTSKLAATDCMTCCAEHHPDAANRVKVVTRDCICSESRPTGCRERCDQYCAGKADDRDCYSCAFRQMRPEAACFRPALAACSDASCVDYLACRSVCAEALLPR